MIAWGDSNAYVAQLVAIQPLIKQQVANRFKIGLFRKTSFYDGTLSIHSTLLVHAVSLYTTLPACEGANLQAATQLMHATANYASINEKKNRQ